VIPLYEQYNSPFVPNILKQAYEEKQISSKFEAPTPGSFKERITPQGIPSAQDWYSKQKPLIDLQVHEPMKYQQPKKKEVLPPLFIPAQTATPFYPPQFNPTWPYYGANPYVPNQMPIIKNYTINVDGPMGDHGQVAMIMEDILPSKQMTTTTNTIMERLNIYSFVRGVFIKTGDGEDIDLNGRGKNSLLSYMKFMELNPYSTSTFSNNPYLGLPDGMLIYRSCYPIRYDNITNSTQCATNSIGMNIRIYQMTNAEYEIKKKQDFKYTDFNLWREIAYYEYIREHVIKKKVSPNFPILYGYYICENFNVDFEKLKQLRGRTQERGDIRLLKQREEEQRILNKTINVVEKIISETGPIPVRVEDAKLGLTQPFTPPAKSSIETVSGELINPLLSPFVTASALSVGKVSSPYAEPILGRTLSGEPIPVPPPFNKELETVYGNPELRIIRKGLVALTEAPTYNIYGWCTKTYKIEGNIKRMVNTGFHKPEVWMSVLFQIMASLYVLQLHKIVINKFSIMDNVYIRDLNPHSNVTTYWKYKIDGVDYYVPNYGYLVMIDSNYKDVDTMTSVLKSNNDYKKILSNIFAENAYDSNKLSDDVFEIFRSVIGPNSFTKVESSAPPEVIQTLLGKINGESTKADANKNIGYYIRAFMGKLMNNRIGKLLTEQEIKNIRPEENKAFTKGQIVVKPVGADAYTFVLYVDKDPSNPGLSIIITKNSPMDTDFIEQTVNNNDLASYSRYEPIVQDYKPTETLLNEEDLLETYVIN